MKSTIVVLSGSDAELSLFDPKPLYAATEIIVVRNDDKRYGGYGEVGNRILDRTDADVVGIVHADATFGSAKSVRTFIDHARESVTGLVGRALDGRYVWSKDILAVESVSTLDSCSLFFPTKLAVRFDTITFDDFHLCVEDFCLQAAAHGLGIRVPPANANHRGYRAYAPDLQAPWMEKYWMYHARFREKWRAVPFAITDSP